MRRLFRTLLPWVGVILGLIALYYLFSVVLAIPVGAWVTVALIVTWVIPGAWRLLVVMAVVGELVTLTPPLALTAAILSPLLLFWLRGRIEVDISFSYVILLATSAALALAIVVGASTYPWWRDIPWVVVLLAWVCSTASAAAGSIILMSLKSRTRHARYF